MNQPDFELQHSVRPPKLLDGECATRNWPMPAAKPWEPRPRADGLEDLPPGTIVMLPQPERLTIAQRIALAWDRVTS